MKSWLILQSPPVLSRFYAEETSAERAATRTEFLVLLAGFEYEIDRSLRE